MTELERINNLLKENGLVAKKSFGQNFLINDGIIKRIVNGMDIDKYETIIEIGPGLASLTLPLSKKAKKLVAVDADRDMVAILKDIFHDNDNVTIIQSDFLRFNPDEYSRKEDRVFIGNLPYNITSELFEYMLEKDFVLAGAMVQKEVADKLMYVKGKKENCPLGAFLKARGEVTLLTNVDSSCFNPAPKVDSAFIRIDKKRDVDFALYPIFKAIFKDPNKTISNCLKQSPKFASTLSVLKEENTPCLALRARQMDIEDIISLTEHIKQIKDSQVEE